VEVECIVLTHGDADHIDALEDLKAIFPVPAGIHPADADRLSVPPDFAIHDGDEIPVGTLRLRVLHTPGHTPGSICLHAPGVLISGDTLFPGGPGATRGDKDRFAQIIIAIREKLFVLPDDTAVLPGHGNPTTIGVEKPSLDEWVARGY
jgi:glyoxylase-like metal-dependent hydrolase (beta-lactamase superfamily II)